MLPIDLLVCRRNGLLRVLIAKAVKKFILVSKNIFMSFKLFLDVPMDMRVGELTEMCGFLILVDVDFNRHR